MELILDHLLQIGTVENISEGPIDFDLQIYNSNHGLLTNVLFPLDYYFHKRDKYSTAKPLLNDYTQINSGFL